MNYKNEYQGGSISFCYERSPLSLYIQADSKNNIFKAKFQTENEPLKSVLDSLCEYSLDKDLDHLITNLSQEFSLEDDWVDYCLLHFKEALYTYGGDKRDLELLDGEQLICRCSKIDANALETIFLRENADRAEILRKTNASMICGNCAYQVNAHLKDLSVKHKIFAGKSFSDWTNLINEALEQFAFYSPEEFQGAEFKVEKLSMPLIELGILVPHKNLSQELAQRSLTNYLSKELELSLEIKVTIDTYLSN